MVGRDNNNKKRQSFLGKGIPDEGKERLYSWLAHLKVFFFVVSPLHWIETLPLLFLFFNLHYQRRAKTKMWVKWQKRVDILSIDYNMFPSCVETISFWRKKSCKIWTFFLYTKDRKHFTAKRRFLRCQRNLGITGIFYHKTASSTAFFFIFSEA